MIYTRDFDSDLDIYLRQGYRLDMIKPADAPVEAVLSNANHTIKLRSTNRLRSSNVDWVTGRAGMAYRDLIPGRLGGRLIASHIKITDAGEVPDYVHYHKIDFQMIYCWHGKVKVVYEDQGDPFWLHPGDCVLQPPEIRHRVLEAAANTQVVELTSPAVHETWIDHDLTLPTGRNLPDRIFGGQRFIHHRATDAKIVYGEFGGFESHHMGIAAASNNTARVFELRTQGGHSDFNCDNQTALNTFYFLLSGRAQLSSDRRGEQELTPGDAVLILPHTEYNLNASANSEILCVEI